MTRTDTSEFLVYSVAAAPVCRRDEHDDFPRRHRPDRQPWPRLIPDLPPNHRDDAVVLNPNTVGNLLWSRSYGSLRRHTEGFGNMALAAQRNYVGADRSSYRPT